MAVLFSVCGGASICVFHSDRSNLHSYKQCRRIPWKVIVLSFKMSVCKRPLKVILRTASTPLCEIRSLMREKVLYLPDVDFVYPPNLHLRSQTFSFSQSKSTPNLPKPSIFLDIVRDYLMLGGEW
jgi:hypothetical protein